MSDKSYGLGTPYEYRINFYEVQYQRQVKAYRTSSLDLLVMPQLNHTIFKKEQENRQSLQGFEAGINVGVAIRKNSDNRKHSYFATLSSGPHYTSDTPSRQMPGFIFSDNLFVGWDYQIFQNLNASFQLGFRHISNAGLSNPNGGVNNIISKAGISLSL